MTRAIIFVSGDDLASSAVRCYDHCANLGYEVEGLIRNDWEEAAELLRNGTVDAMVVSSASQLDPHRRPRVEVVAEQRDPSLRHRRSRIIPRGAGA